jgi:hypothetical protein
LLAIFEPTLANAAQFRPFTAPTQLCGKSITLKWINEFDGKLVTRKTRHWVNDVAYGFYVSTKGRVFSQGAFVVRGQQGRLGLGYSRDPEGGAIKTPTVHYHSVWQFHGRMLVATNNLRAARIA